MHKLLITARQMTSIQLTVEHEVEAIDTDVLWRFPQGQQFNSDEMIALAVDAAVVIAGDDVMDEAFFNHCPHIKRIIRWGVGMDSVDIHAAKSHGIEVVNTPGILGRSVAEYALGFIFMLSRQQHQVDAGIRGGLWPKPQGRSVLGKTLGIVGYGDVGRQVGAFGQALGLNVVWFDPNTIQSREIAGRSLALDDVARQSDFLVLACPLTDSTRNIVDASLLGKMKPESYLVNVSRGGVVNQPDLVHALEAKDIAGAALDVFENEPLQPDHPLRSLPNVILGSHNASNTEEGVRQVSEEALRLALEVLKP